MIIATMYFSAKKRLACLRTVCSHIDNLFNGTIKGFRHGRALTAVCFPLFNATAAAL